MGTAEAAWPCPQEQNQGTKGVLLLLCPTAEPSWEVSCRQPRPRALKDGTRLERGWSKALELVSEQHHSCPLLARGSCCRAPFPDFVGCEALLWLRGGEQTQLRVWNQPGSPRRRQGLALVGHREGHCSVPVTGTGPPNAHLLLRFLLSPVGREPLWAAGDGKTGRKREPGSSCASAATP